ncbi:nucleotidyltransferase domain-containing protein [Chitinispirillales bacterium ANBcel5]|uniref:hypothetical protein n=1 Tax=Cellulosispirillum alkaliphilum TaxID=3039283 RepID=UPI002A51EADC|nr:nucleotidyltransferase domain-containing protein [Chitinispirillales bacterium ANBcel5]
MKNIVDPVEYSKTAVEPYKSLYGEDLISVILYGSAAGGDFDPKKSDINLLIVLSSMDVELVAKSSDLQAKLLRQRFSTPFIMDKEYITNSLDSYPIEFLDMKGCYRVIYGEDVLETVSPQKEHLRIQVERELKGKWLHLLQEFPYARKNGKSLLQLTSLSLKAYAPIFRGLLMLKGEKVPFNRNELFKAIESAYEISGTPFQEVAKACSDKDTSRLETQFVNYARAVKTIINAIEKSDNHGGNR